MGPANRDKLPQNKKFNIGLFSSRYWDVSLPWVRSPPYSGVSVVYTEGFPHSEISGSKVARHLPEAYRSHATSFIAVWNQGIHRTPLFPIRKLVTEYVPLQLGKHMFNPVIWDLNSHNKSFDYLFPALPPPSETPRYKSVIGILLSNFSRPVNHVLAYPPEVFSLELGWINKKSAFIADFWQR